MATVTLRPNTDYNDWEGEFPVGNQYETVDEATPDEDTSYIYESRTAARHRGRCLLTATGLSGVTIDQIEVFVRAKSSVAGDEIQVSIKSDTTNTDGTVQAITTSYVNYSQVWATNPATGLAWTISELDALIAGIREETNQSGTIRCTQIYVVVTYTVPAVAAAKIDRGGGEIPAPPEVPMPPVPVEPIPSEIVVAILAVVGVGALAIGGKPDPIYMDKPEEPTW